MKYLNIFTYTST